MADEQRIALIGYGLAGSTFHAPLITAVPGLRVTAVVTRNPDRADQARAALPGVTVVGSADDIWNNRDHYDGVVVATSNDTHVTLATRALEAGLPVVVDKPLAVTAAQAQRLVDVAADCGVLLTVYQNRRWDADLLTLQRVLADGTLGDVMRFESRFERWRPVPKDNWRESGDPARGGGILLDLGSHLVDQATHLFGPVAAVYAEIAVRRPGASVDDDVFMALHHVGGVTSHLWVSAVAAHPGPRLRVLGTNAAYVCPDLDPQEAALRAGRSPADRDWGVVPEPKWGRVVAGDDGRVVPSEHGAWPAFYIGWREAILGNGPVPVDPRDAVETLRLLEAARESARKGRVVGTSDADRQEGG